MPSKISNAEYTFKSVHFVIFNVPTKILQIVKSLKLNFKEPRTFLLEIGFRLNWPNLIYFAVLQHMSNWANLTETQFPGEKCGIL